MDNEVNMLATCTAAFSFVALLHDRLAAEFPGVTEHGLPQTVAPGASILRILPYPRDSILGQKLLPQGKSSPCTGTLALGYFHQQSNCPRAFPLSRIYMYTSSF